MNHLTLVEQPRDILAEHLVRLRSLRTALEIAAEAAALSDDTGAFAETGALDALDPDGGDGDGTTRRPSDVAAEALASAQGAECLIEEYIGLVFCDTAAAIDDVCSRITAARLNLAVVKRFNDPDFGGYRSLVLVVGDRWEERGDEPSFVLEVHHRYLYEAAAAAEHRRITRFWQRRGSGVRPRGATWPDGRGRTGTEGFAGPPRGGSVRRVYGGSRASTATVAASSRPIAGTFPAKRRAGASLSFSDSARTPTTSRRSLRGWKRGTRAHCSP